MKTPTPQHAPGRAVRSGDLVGQWSTLHAAFDAWLAAPARLTCRRWLLQFRILLLKFPNPRVLFHQFAMQNKLVLLYLLDKRACLAVLRELNESSKKLADLRNSINGGHNGSGAVAPNGRAEPQPPTARAAAGKDAR